MRPLKIFRSVAAISSALILFSCSNTQEKTVPNAVPYYDFKAFINGEIQRLKSSDDSVYKSIFWDGNQDSLRIPVNNINWNNELAWFLELDLNKPAYQGRYAADTTKHDSLELEVHYRPLHEKFAHTPPLVSAFFARHSDGHYEVGGMIGKKTLFVTQVVTIYYSSDEQYNIHGFEEMEFIGTRHQFDISGFFKPSGTW